ncbi:hypothetical protein Mal64_07300 [Pseudobythopirellula maris]|uniref:DUF3124 domain-containing protein n=1 Tax=Pseudobythopirellula maris TaxID=2527991 RepID=A0A5C5ZS35_9BACT|nr:DUF3124 domain-containing protein [Pseudobythopirellula maris]TWT90342.1 hypothetical protein Mal64_07300 [Pseudobythopirellula maris]
MAKRITPQEADAFMRQLKTLVIAGVLLVLVPLIFYAVYLDKRLATFEESLSHSPPDELEVDDFGRDDLKHLAANATEGEVVYVPAYSHIYHGSGEPYLLTITLSVRNTSVNDAIVVKSVRYFDTKGKEVKSYLEKPVRLAALGTTEVVIKREDATGGSGANFLVEWFANTPVPQPIIEAVMIDTNSQHGISFVGRGKVISQASAGDEAQGTTEPPPAAP